MLPAISARDSRQALSRTITSPTRQLNSSLGRTEAFIRTPSPIRPILLRFNSRLRSESRDLKLTKLRGDLEELTCSREKIKQKMQLVHLLERSHKVSLKGLNCRKYSEEQLVNIADYRRRQQLAMQTATQMKFFNSSRRLVRVLHNEATRQTTAAQLIQRQWRVHKVTI